MGFHYINGALLDTTLDPTQPEALVYAPNANGRLRLVAVEYVVFQEPWIAEHGDEMPMLFGQEFMPVGFPNRYEIPAFFALHAWIWKNNPSGTFAPSTRPSPATDGYVAAAGAERRQHAATDQGGPRTAAGRTRSRGTADALPGTTHTAAARRLGGFPKPPHPLPS